MRAWPALRALLTKALVLSSLATSVTAQPPAITEEPIIEVPSGVLGPPRLEIDPALLPDLTMRPGAVLDPEVLGALYPHGLSSPSEAEADLVTLNASWKAEAEAFLSEVEATPYTLEDLSAAVVCLAEGGACDSPVAHLLTSELTRFGAHDCGTDDVVLALGLANRIGVLEEFSGTLSGISKELPAPPIESRQTVPVPPNCGPKQFRSRAGRFDIFYNDCDPRIGGFVDTTASFTDLTGTTVALVANGGVFNLGNAPDSVEVTGLLLDSAIAVMAADFRVRTGTNRYQVFLEDVAFSGLTGAVGYVSPVTGVATVSPSRLPQLNISDLRQFPSTVAVHELIHQVQFDYGWNLSSFLFDDNFNFENFSPTGRHLLEGTAEAVTNHVHNTLPIYFPSRATTNYYDFWAGNSITGGRDPLGYGWIMQALSTDATGTVCTGCEIAHQMFTFFGANDWSRDAFFRFVLARDPRLTPLEIPRQFFLHQLFDRFANIPLELARSTQRLPESVRPNINVRSFAPDENTCQLPAGTKYAIQSKDGSTVRCKFRPFPTAFSGIPQMVYLPVDALPELLQVRIDIGYVNSNTGQTVTKIGGRQLFNNVHVIEATGGAEHYDNRWFWANKILNRHYRRWGPGPHQFTISTQSIDFSSKQPDYRSPMRSLAFAFEWDPTPPTPNFLPTWEITVLSKRLDIDGDGVFDRDDRCPLDADPSNANTDGDGLGDVCDPDIDNDRIPNELDLCPTKAGGCDADRDGDNLANDRDNCPDVANWDQANRDGDDQGDACDSDSKPDLVITEGSIPPAGAGFVVKNVGTAPAQGPLHYHVSGYVTGPAGRVFFQRTLEFPLHDGVLAPGGRASTEIPEALIDPALRSSYQNVRVTIDSTDDVDELDETNNSLGIR